MTSVHEKDRLQSLNIEERQVLKNIEDQIVDILLILDSTSDTISSVSEMYKQFCDASPAMSQDVNDEPDLISFSLHEKQRDVVHNRRKVETLLVKVQGTATLVRICFFVILDLQNSDEQNLVIQPSGLWKWKISQKACRRISKGELYYTRACREKHARCCCSQGTYNHNIDILACDSRISQSHLEINLLNSIAHEVSEFLFHGICEHSAKYK